MVMTERLTIIFLAITLFYVDFAQAKDVYLQENRSISRTIQKNDGKIEKNPQKSTSVIRNITSIPTKTRSYRRFDWDYNKRRYW